MLFIKLAYFLPLGVLSVLANCTATTATLSSSINIPTPTYLFTATLHVGDPLKPIPLLQGGTVRIEPLTNGTISGPYLNGTIQAGFAAAVDVANNTITGRDTTIQIPSIYIYGETSDGLPLFVQEAGVGPEKGQTTRLVVAVGGRYRSLQTSFIIGQPTINEARTVVKVPCFSVPLPLGA